MLAEALNVLVVENDPDHVELIRRSVESGLPGADLRVARSLEEARAVLATTPPDLVITDLRLPDGEGTDLLPRHPHGPWFPLMVITGLEDDVEAATAIKRGAPDYVVKTRHTSAEFPRIVQRTLQEWQFALARRQAEQRLRLSEERNRFFAQAIERSSQPFGFGFIDGRLGQVNRAFCELVGYTEDELRQICWIRDITPPEWREVEAVHLAALEHTGQPVRYEKEYVRKDGCRVPVELLVHLARGDATQPDCYWAFVTDLTERRRTECQLQKLSLAVEQSPASVVITDPTGQIEYVNPKFTQLTGYSLDAVRGKNPSILKSGNMPAEHYQQMWQTIRAGDQWRGEFLNKKKSGELYWESASISPIFDEARKITHFVAVKEDITERKELETVLALRERQLNSFFLGATAGLAFFDWDLRFIRINDTLAEMNGVALEEHIGKSVREVIPSLAELIEPVLRRVLATGQPVLNVEICGETYKHKGVERHWINSFFPIAGPAGTPDAVGVIVVEITERKQAESALRRSDLRFRQAIDTSPDAIAILDLDTRILLANLRSAQLLGFDSVDQLLASVGSAFEILAPEDRDRARTSIRTLLEVNVLRNQEYCIIRRDGSKLPAEVSTSLERDTEGNPQAMILVIRDISERRQAELRQQRSLQRLEKVNRLQADLLVPTPLPKRCTKITDFAWELLELDLCRIWLAQPGDLCNQGCVYASEKAGQPACDRKECLHLIASSGRYTHIDGKYRRIPVGAYAIGSIASGTAREFLTNDLTTDPQIADHEWARSLGLVSFGGYRLRDGHGRLLGVLGTFARHPTSDEDHAFLSNLAETASKVILESRTAEQLREKSRQAEESNRLKSEFLANMSHEIRTPMTAILGFSDLLRTPNLTVQDHHDFVEGIHRNADLLLQLISDILDLSKIEADKLRIESVPCCPRQIVEDVVTMLSERAASKGLALRTGYEAGVPELVRSDPTRLRQILVNLIGNAIKFTEQGIVSVAVRCVRQQGRQRLTFEVSDTGIGIPADQIPCLFKPFSQVDGSLTRRYGGTGLGLVLAKQLAGALGGEISLVSTEGKGSTFTLGIDGELVPSRDLPQWEGPAGQSRGIPGARRPLGKVLLVEDVPDVQQLMLHLFRILQVAADVADDGEIACQRAKTSLREGKPYDLILMDIQLPVLNGLEATRRLRHEGWTGPIVAVTAHAMVGDRERCLEAGCNDYLSKPISQRALQSTLDRYCGQKDCHAVVLPQEPPASERANGLLQGGLLGPDAVARLLEQYAHDLPATARAMQAALNQGDLSTVAILSHRLTGTAGTYGFEEIADIARAVHQQATQSDDLEVITATLSELQSLCRQTVEQVLGESQCPNRGADRKED